MNKDKDIESEFFNQEIIGTGQAFVNQNSESFRALQKAIQEHYAQMSEKQKIDNKLLSLRFKLENYLNPPPYEVPDILSVGSLLEEFIQALQVSKKEFAHYIGYQESNLSALLKGRRRINTELALKLGQIFNLDPVLWLNLQNKQEIQEVSERQTEYKKLTYEDLIKPEE